MAIKYKVSKEEHAALSDELRGEYALVGNDYVLSLDGGPDTKAGEKFAAERDRRRAAEKRATDAEARIVELEDQFSDTKTAIERAEKKAADAKKAAEMAEKKHVDYLTKAEVDAAATKLAGELAPTAAKVLLPHVRARLALDLTDAAAPKVVVLGADGKPSEMTVESLAKEFRDNKDFAGIITASRANGGGASRGAGNVGGNGVPAYGAHNTQQAAKPLSSMNASELAAHIDARRASANS